VVQQNLLQIPQSMNYTTTTVIHSVTFPFNCRWRSDRHSPSCKKTSCL